MTTTSRPQARRALAPGLALAGTLSLLLSSTAHAQVQPEIGARSKAVLEVDGLQFKDSNGNGTLDAYEDWRLAIEDRVADLLPRMSVEEKAGMMLIDTLNAGCEGTSEDTRAGEFVNEQFMTRFILRNVVDSGDNSCEGRAPRGGFAVTPAQIAGFANTVQEMNEARPLGIPAVFKSNARNHYETDPRFGISSGAGAMTEFPKEAGIAAAVLGTGEITPVEKLTEVMSAEWRAIGIRAMYGYMADLATEPRWYRVHETFTEDSALATRIMSSLVGGLQGGPTSPETSVALTMKHFPGGGPQQLGLDPHYSFGQDQVYPGGAFGDHVAPFKAAVEAGVSSIMPYYGVPIDTSYAGTDYDEVGFAFSEQILNGLLREELGFEGYVNSDTGIIEDRAWGLETATLPERVAAAINAGTDVLSGFADHEVITSLLADGLLTEERMDLAVSRLLAEQFALGLFENPYVDAAAADAVVGSDAHRAAGLEVQRQSVVLLQNTDAALPMDTAGSVYVLGMAPEELSGRGFTVTDGNPAEEGAARATAEGNDRAVIRVQVHNVNTSDYRTQDAAYGANPDHINPVTGETWGAQDPCNVAPEQNPVCTDDMNIGPVSLGLLFGGPLPWESNMLSFTAMEAAESWEISPSLADIQGVMQEVGPQNTVIAIDFRSPYVLDVESGLRDAGAIIATFGVSDRALIDVIDGSFAPVGKLPFALADNLAAIEANAPDLPGYPEADTLYPFGFGLGY